VATPPRSHCSTSPRSLLLTFA
jgi:hypothetical protein